MSYGFFKVLCVPYLNWNKKCCIYIVIFYCHSAYISKFKLSINNSVLWLLLLGVPDSDDDEVDCVTSKDIENAKLKKEEEELSKIASGIGKVFLKNVQEREKMKQWKAANLDPRNASR